MGSRCHYPFSDRGGVRAHLRLPLTSGRARLLSNPAATLKKTKSRRGVSLRCSRGRTVKVFPHGHQQCEKRVGLFA